MINNALMRVIKAAGCAIHLIVNKITLIQQLPIYAGAEIKGIWKCVTCKAFPSYFNGSSSSVAHLCSSNTVIMHDTLYQVFFASKVADISIEVIRKYLYLL